MELSRGFIVGLMGSVVSPLNLSLTDYHDPQENHILDAEVHGNTLIISTMIQGIEFYAGDLNGDEILNVLDIVQMVNGVLSQ